MQCENLDQSVNDCKYDVFINLIEQRQKPKHFTIGFDRILIGFV